MAKQDVIDSIPEESKETVNILIVDIKDAVDLIETEKCKLFEKGNKASIGKIRKSGQTLKKLGQDLRVLILNIRKLIDKTSE